VPEVGHKGGLGWQLFEVLGRVFRKCSLKGLSKPLKRSISRTLDLIDLPDRRPTLCPGCPHRAAFFAIKKAFPKAIFTSDIGCYTLGINLGAVDTILEMPWRSPSLLLWETPPSIILERQP